MDWVWRICLGFAAMWVVRETNIGMVADMRTDNGLFINSVVQASIATLGALPLCFKTIGLMNGKKIAITRPKRESSLLQLHHFQEMEWSQEIHQAQVSH